VEVMLVKFRRKLVLNSSGEFKRRQARTTRSYRKATACIIRCLILGRKYRDEVERRRGEWLTDCDDLKVGGMDDGGQLGDLGERWLWRQKEWAGSRLFMEAVKSLDWLLTFGEAALWCFFAGASREITNGPEYRSECPHIRWL
jgi:hypothetical protein